MGHEDVQGGAFLDGWHVCGPRPDVQRHCSGDQAIELLPGVLVVLLHQRSTVFPVKRVEVDMGENVDGSRRIAYGIFRETFVEFH